MASKFICNFCNNSLESLKSLNLHKKTNKKCLQIQNNEILLLSCNYCSKKFNKGNLKTHLKTCKEKKIFEYEELLTLYKNSVIETESLKNENNFLKEKIEFYRHEYQKNQEIVIEMAKEPKTKNSKISFNNNTNNIFNLFNKPEKVKDLIEQYLSTDHLIDGQKGVAEFTFHHLIKKDEDGNYNYFCSDPSRSVFRYNKENGETGRDIEAEHLTTLLLLGDLKKQSIKKAEKIWTNEDGSHDSEMYNLHIKNAQDVVDIDKDNTTFRKCLAKMIS